MSAHCDSPDIAAQGPSENASQEISVAISNALSGQLVAEFSLPITSTVNIVKTKLIEQGHPLMHSLLLDSQPLDDDACLQRLPLATDSPTIEFQMLCMAKRRVQLARALGRSSLGCLLFQGPVPSLGQGEWLGLEMDDPYGECDGTELPSRKVYFPCKAKCGLFARPDDVRFVNDETDLEENERVTVCQRHAKVCFRGTTKFADGEWVGLELEDRVGKNNGIVQGIRYWWCEKEHGIFVRPNNVNPVPAAAA